MDQKKQIIVKINNRQKYSARITDTAIYEYKETDLKHSKKLIIYNDDLSVRIIKTEIMNNNKYRFIVKFYEDKNNVEVVVDGREELQKMYRIVGIKCCIQGLQQFLSSFKKIGQGSFAQVYEAITNYQAKFALKSFEKKGIQNNQKTKRAYLNEIDVMKKLNSPYIVAFDYIFQTDRAYYLKMQHFQKTLKEKFLSKMVVKSQKRFMKHILMALHQMKMKGVIHRDLKPENIMIRANSKGEEECVIIDFGLATFSDALPYLYFRCGTPGFLSPQIANLSNKKEKQLPSSDVFSAGCIFYKMLTGHYLFAGKTAKQVLYNNRKCQYSVSFEGLSMKQKSLLLKMIDANPNTRITPQEALKHAYFEEDVDDCDEIPDQQCPLQKKLKRIVNNKVKNMETVYSSMSSFQGHSMNSQAYRGSKKRGLKDSCLTFDLGLNSGESFHELSLTPTKRSTDHSPTFNMSKTSKHSRFSKIPV